MRIIDATNARAVTTLLEMRSSRDPRLRRRVSAIVDRVRRDGDRAVSEYVRRFDGFNGPIEVTRHEIERRAREVEPALREAIALAAIHIRRVAARQMPRRWTMTPAAGIAIEQRVLPLERVGCYVPGGRHPLPSSLLMTAIPARAAGVAEVFVACPRPDACVMAAAVEAGVSRLFRMGGAHAIAALAYGTATVPRVDKIVGPGSAFVAAAKAQVSPDCAIDFDAGPTEIAIVSDSGRPEWIAADLVAQAEHDPDARAILFTPSRRLARLVAQEIRRQVPTDGPARTSLQNNGGIVVTRTLDQAIALCQRMAPEHVVCDSDAAASRLTRAGTVFVGRFSAPASGDYVTGSSHVLPTGGVAAARGGLHVVDFLRLSTVQRVTSAGLRYVAPAGIALAEAEGLRAHAASIRIRLKRS